MNRVATRPYGLSVPHQPSRSRLRVIALLRSLQFWLQKQAVLEELHGCDDRTLQDLGISRSDFDAIASGTYRRYRRDGEEATAPTPGHHEVWPYF
jgi:uncharacterized protein YjiS (DUF1127 family)